MITNNRFKEKVILVFGGAKGIGRSIVGSFAREGGIVHFTDIDDKEGNKVVENAHSQGWKVSFFKADILNENEVKGAVSKIINESGRIDILVNNVRGPKDTVKNPLNYSLSQWMDSLKHIEGGVYLTCKLVLPHMITQNEGIIVNIASISGRYIGSESLSYHTAKAALLQFSKCLADKYGPSNIRANCVSPGFIVQEESLSSFNEDKNKNYREAALLTHPLRKIGSPEDVAKAVLFLASADAQFITGENLIVDGGLTIRDQWSVANQIRSNFQK